MGFLFFLTFLFYSAEIITSFIYNGKHLVNPWTIVAIMAVPLVIFLISYINSKKMKPTQMECPYCKSKNIEINLTTTGMVGANLGNGIGVAQSIKGKYAKCNDCGSTFDFVAQSEVESTQNNKLGRFVILLIMFVAFILVNFLK